jgi:hypothetical protein
MSGIPAGGTAVQIRHGGDVLRELLLLLLLLVVVLLHGAAPLDALTDYSALHAGHHGLIWLPCT